MANTVLFTGSRTITANNIGISNWYFPLDNTRVNADPATYMFNRFCNNGSYCNNCCWYYIETSKGVYNWTYTDKWVDTYATLGKNLIVELCYTPDWANTTMTPGAGNKAPTNMADFASWVTVVGNRYKGKIKYWFIRNEMTLDSAAKHAELTRVAYQILKSIDPTNKILGTEISNIPDISGHFTAFANASAVGYDAGFGTGAGTLGKNWIDIVSIHPYAQGTASPLTGEILNVQDWINCKATLNTLGLSTLPIWSTECMYTGSDLNATVAKWKRSMIISLLYSDLYVWFGWGASSAQLNKNDLTGINARIVWNQFMSTLFSSPITQVVLNEITAMVEVTQANGNVFVV
jgi:hypothetical protein